MNARPETLLLLPGAPATHELVDRLADLSAAAAVDRVVMAVAGPVLRPARTQDPRFLTVEGGRGLVADLVACLDAADPADDSVVVIDDASRPPALPGTVEGLVDALADPDVVAAVAVAFPSGPVKWLDPDGRAVTLTLEPGRAAVAGPVVVARAAPLRQALALALAHAWPCEDAAQAVERAGGRVVAVPLSVL